MSGYDDRPNSLLLWIWRVAVICRKEFAQFFRNWVLAVFMLYSVTFMAYNTANSISHDLKNAQLVVIDHDRSGASRELVHRFREPQFRFAGQLEHVSQGVEMLDDGSASLVLDIPPNFEHDLREGRQTQLQVQLDGADSTRAYLTSAYAANIVSEFGQDWARASASADSMSLPIVEMSDAFGSVLTTKRSFLPRFRIWRSTSCYFRYYFQPPRCLARRNAVRSSNCWSHRLVRYKSCLERSCQ